MTLQTTCSNPLTGQQIQPEKTNTEITESVLSSTAMTALRSLLARQGQRIDPQAIVYKDLSATRVRLMFPVTGGEIVRGTVVAVVCLFDRVTDQTLYAHPMHAGPEVNPLVGYVDSPMSAPKPQDGANGSRADGRIIQHKKALWARFLEALPELGREEAGRRWREGYYWALKRLYFCCGCSQCKWGSPFFDGPTQTSPRKQSNWVAATAVSTGAAQGLSDRHADLVARILASDAWQIEARYAKRGGYTLHDQPRLIQPLGADHVQVIFPTTVSMVQGGALVAAAFTFDIRSFSVLFSYCLCAGPEADIQLLRGDSALGLPQALPAEQLERARGDYRAWRRDAWTRFWMDELDSGIAVASQRWLDGLWRALEGIFGGNEIGEFTVDVPVAIDSPASTASQGPELPPQALQNMGGRCFSGFSTNRQGAVLRATGLNTLMVNMGFRCNLACSHCHVDAGPNRREAMTRETVDQVLQVLREHGISTLDITGGAPEMNPNFQYLATEAIKAGCRVVDRCNLTLFFEPGYEDLPEFLAEHGIEVMASLPSLKDDIADQQRGLGTFKKSIAALQRLNGLGYAAKGSGLLLNLVSNPSGTELGGQQDALEAQYKRELQQRYDIRFNRLLVMNNMPIKRFAHFLRREARLDDYTDRLVWAFNPETVAGAMCRQTLSVAYDGRLYDCDFNQMAAVPLSHGLPAHIGDFDFARLQSRAINTSSHCFGCTAGAGSSCNGALARIFRPFRRDL